MSDRDEMLKAAIDSFESAARSFDSARRLLLVLIANDDEDEKDTTGVCHHKDAVEVTTLGDGPSVWVCSDCGEQFQ